MALNEAQEKELTDGLASMKKQFADIAPVLAEVPAMKASLAAKDKEIADLKAGLTPLTVNSAHLALKTAYPDVPEATLTALADLPAEKQKAILEPAQKAAAELKTSLVKTDPSRGWEDAGSIEASTEAERIAQRAERKKAYVEHAKQGNLSGMLNERATEIAAFCRRAFATK